MLGWKLAVSHRQMQLRTTAFSFIGLLQNLKIHVCKGKKPGKAKKLGRGAMSKTGGGEGIAFPSPLPPPP